MFISVFILYILPLNAVVVDVCSEIGKKIKTQVK